MRGCIISKGSGDFAGKHISTSDFAVAGFCCQEAQLYAERDLGQTIAHQFLDDGMLLFSAHLRRGLWQEFLGLLKHVDLALQQRILHRGLHLRLVALQKPASLEQDVATLPSLFALAFQTGRPPWMGQDRPRSPKAQAPQPHPRLLALAVCPVLLARQALDRVQRLEALSGRCFFGAHALLSLLPSFVRTSSAAALSFSMLRGRLKSAVARISVRYFSVASLPCPGLNAAVGLCNS